MPFRLLKWRPTPGALALTALVALTLALAFWRPMIQVSFLGLGAAALAFLLAPLCAKLERRLSRPAAALTVLASLLAALILAVWLLLPAALKDLGQLVQALPSSLNRLAEAVNALTDGLQARMPGLRLSLRRLEGFAPALPDLANGTLALAGSVGTTLSTVSLTVMLSFFFLCDRDRLLLRMELLVPRAHRQMAARMGGAVLRELRLYLKGQLLVALAVGSLTAAGLWLAGVRSAAALGAIAGLLNMVPYFGPLIGGVPAVMIALGDGWRRALMALGVLTLVQQVDNALISPRVMGHLTGLSPASVLIAIYTGSVVSGIGGMLLSLPIFMSIRTVFRVFVQTRENI